jgi:hypothetical protein
MNINNTFIYVFTGNKDSLIVNLLLTESDMIDQQSQSYKKVSLNYSKLNLEK